MKWMGHSVPPKLNFDFMQAYTPVASAASLVTINPQQGGLHKWTMDAMKFEGCIALPPSNIIPWSSKNKCCDL